MSFCLVAARPRPLRQAAALAAAVCALLAWSPSQAVAFDTGPHLEMMRDVLVREGVAANGDAMAAMEVANYQVDGFGSAQDIIDDSDAAGIRYQWIDMYPEPCRSETERLMHFGYRTRSTPEHPTAFSDATKRMVKNTMKAVKQAEAANDPVGFLAVLGSTLHWVEDFYAHTNWAPKSVANKWGEKTWFDVDPAVSAAAGVNQFDHEGNAMDFPGHFAATSQYYPLAYRQAFYASWQWVKMVRTWVSPSFWTQAMGTTVPNIKDMRWDIGYLSWYAGHWKGPDSRSDLDLFHFGINFANKHCSWGWGYEDPMALKLSAYSSTLCASDDPNVAMPTSYPTVPEQQWLNLDTVKVGEVPGGDIEPLGTPDFYARIYVNGVEYREMMYEGADDVYTTHWDVWAPLDPSMQNVNVRYELWDEDVTAGGIVHNTAEPDDHCNIMNGTGWDWTYSGPLASLPTGLVKTQGSGDEGEINEAYVWLYATRRAAGPPVADPGLAYVAYEGSQVVFDGSKSTDPQGDALMYRWDVDFDGEYETGWSSSPKTTYTFGKHTFLTLVWLQVTDGIEVSDPCAALVTVVSVAPSVEAGVDQTVDEGTSVSFAGSFTDPGWLDTHTYKWDFGDGATDAGASSSSHTYADDGSYAVVFEVTDTANLSGTDSLTMTVNNVAPTVGAVSSSAKFFILPSITTTFRTTFSDPGWLDTHTSGFDFGDGTTGAGVLSEENAAPAASGSSEGSHAFLEPGVYTLTGWVKDDDGGTGSSTLSVTVLDAPSALDALAEYVEALPDSAFVTRARTRRAAFAAQFAAVDRLIAASSYAAAIEVLEHAVLPKVDGPLGGIAADDWVSDPDGCSDIALMVEDLTSYLNTLIE